MKTIGQLSYDTNFIWRGQIYTQVIRIKNAVGSHKITCRLLRGQSEWVDMPSGRKVKPFIKFDTLQVVR